jgi:hypothetical protein
MAGRDQLPTSGERVGLEQDLDRADLFLLDDFACNPGSS